ncbi:MAG: GNAT family N-acetyltransferase [Burkholderiaceae bacterium]|jgi:CelD/BcsL family acetyltransferase involved in cellulose biosynthesis
MGAELTAHTSPLHPNPKVPAWWGDLFARSESATLFLSSEWIQTWLDVYASKFGGFWVRWVAQDNTVGGCLILKRTVWWQIIPQPTLFLNVAAETVELSPWSEFNQPLYIAGYAEAVAEALAHLVNRIRWARFEFWGYEDGAFSQAFLKSLSQYTLQTREERAPFVDLKAIEGQEYEGTLSSKTRPQIRRSRRMYEDSGGPVEIRFAQDEAEALAFLAELGIMHNAIWRSRGEVGSFERPEFRSFHEEVVKRLWAAQAVDLIQIKTSEKVIGYLFNFKLGKKIYCYQSGFVQEEDKNFKPGLLTHATAISAYMRLQYEEYDLLSGDSRYKRSLTKNGRTLFWSTAYRRSAYGRLLWLARQLKARWRSKAAAQDPDSAAGIVET